MQAYLAGLEAARDNGHDLSGLSSVASFFVSRVDIETDKRLRAVHAPAALLGQAAIANARLAYQHYERVFSSDRWKALEQAGATRQRPLWASTGVKDPGYDDTRYVVELVAPGSVSTMPEATLDAVVDHGQVRGDTVTATYAHAQQTLNDLAAAGIDYDDVVQHLEDEGLRTFDDAWNERTESVTASLEQAGATITAQGAASPPGPGPAAASPAAGA